LRFCERHPEVEQAVDELVEAIRRYLLLLVDGGTPPRDRE
jgi:hypothetical protein